MKWVFLMLAGADILVGHLAHLDKVFSDGVTYFVGAVILFRLDSK